MRTKSKIAWIALAVVVALCAAAGIWFAMDRARGERSLHADLDQVVAAYRRIIVVMDSAGSLDEATRARCRATGRRIFWDKQQALETVSSTLAHTRASFPTPSGMSPQTISATRTGWLSSTCSRSWAAAAAPSNETRTALANVHAIQNTYREEVSRIFSQFATRGADGKREKWDAYVAWLRTTMSRDRILAEFGDGLTDEMETGTRGIANPNEIWGQEFETHNVALTFDDGPHRKYTEEITALLRKYGLRASFFEWSSCRSLGTVDGDNVKVLPVGEISRRLVEAGHTVANHTYSHRALTKLSEEERTQEIGDARVCWSRKPRV